MKTTIVIPNYNGLHFLPDCMDALNAQTCRDFDVVVVDNGSKDGSYPWLRNWQAEDADRRHGIYLSENLGFPAAVNKGILWAMEHGSQYVILLNNDTKADPRFVEALNAAMDKDKKKRYFAFSSRMIKMHSPSVMDDAGDQYTVLGWAFQRGLDEPVSAWNQPADVFSACAGAAIYRLDALKVTGLFDEAHFAYLEDLDLSWRAQLCGYRIGYLPDAVCQHVGSGTSGSKYNSFKVRLSARNSLYVIAKNMPLFQIILNAPAILTGIAVKQVFFLRKGFGKDYALGLLEAFRLIQDYRNASENRRFTELNTGASHTDAAHAGTDAGAKPCDSPFHANQTSLQTADDDADTHNAADNISGTFCSPRINKNEIPPLRYLVIELKLITGTLEYLSKAARKCNRTLHG